MKRIKLLCALLSLTLLQSCFLGYDLFTGSIMGTVTDSTTGGNLMDVVVTISPTNESQNTSIFGFYEFTYLTPQEYEITASKSGYETKSIVVTVVAGQSVTGDIQLVPTSGGNGNDNGGDNGGDSNDSSGDVTKAKITTCDENLEFSLTSSKISGTTATLEMKIKNNGNKTSKLTLIGGGYGESYAYDDQGNKYSNVKMSLSGDYETYYSTDTEIPAGVTTKLTVKIENIASEGAVFNYIKIKTNKDCELVLENVPIGKRTPASLPVAKTTGSIESHYDDIEFTLVDCKYGTENTVLKLRAKNVGNEYLTLGFEGGGYGNSYAFDDEGNKYTSNALGASFSGADKTPYNTTAEIPAGIFINCEITFNEVDPLATEFSIINIKTNQGNDLILKNVKINK